MPMNPAFVQLILGMQDITERRREQALRERAFGESQSQFKELTKQFERTTGDKEFADALNTLQSLVPEQQAAYLQLQKSRTGQQNPDMVAAFQAFANASPTAQGMRSMDPNQRQSVNQNAAALQATGGRMGMGQVGASSLEGAMALGGQPPAAMAQFLQGQTPTTAAINQGFQGSPPTSQLPQQAPQSMGGVAGDPSAWQQMVQNYAQRAATGYTPAQMEVNRFNASTGRNAVEVDYAKLNEMHNQFMADYGLKTALSKQPNQLTPGDAAQLMSGMGNLLNDMKGARASKEDNLARQQLYNSANRLLQQSGYLPTGNFTVPNAGQNGTVGDPNSPFAIYMRNMGVGGAPQPGQFNPMQQMLPHAAPYQTQNPRDLYHP